MKLFEYMYSNKKYRSFGAFSPVTTSFKLEDFTMDGKTVTETQIGNTTYIVKSECSPNATETVEKKLERLILRHVSDTESYQDSSDKGLAMCLKQSEYGTDN